MGAGEIHSSNWRTIMNASRAVWSFPPSAASPAHGRLCAWLERLDEAIEAQRTQNYFIS